MFTFTFPLQGQGSTRKYEIELYVIVMHLIPGMVIVFCVHVRVRACVFCAVQSAFGEHGNKQKCPLVHSARSASACVQQTLELNL